MGIIIPVAAIIATKDRILFLKRTLSSVLSQSHLPAEILIIDASPGDHLDEIQYQEILDSGIKFIYQKATIAGATHQRVEGIKLSTSPIIWFLDDDIILESDCTKRIYQGFSHQDRVGAVNAMIINQQYTAPGRITATMYQWMHGKRLDSYAGKVIGPAWNLLPEDSDRLGEYVDCEWLNTGCTMYKKEALPSPIFPDFFKGYSMLEDLTLSSTIRKRYILLNARTARIFHDSQPGSYKSNAGKLSRMALVNRYYVMTRVLKRNGWSYHFKFFIFEVFGVVSNLRSIQAWKNLPLILIGKISGVIDVARAKW